MDTVYSYTLYIYIHNGQVSSKIGWDGNHPSKFMGDLVHRISDGLYCGAAT